ncbi:MAG: OmpH family outer membrane protein [Bacteroidetes bacterium]|nr:OmpH family outer membrane protein [Bacteroidota bacterium]
MIRTRVSVLAVLLLVVAFPAMAQQKIAYVDIAAIMKDLPEAQEAQRILDAQVDRWQQELQQLEDEWQAKFNDYDKRKLILTDQGRARAEKDLQELDARIMDYRDAKFGQDGELFKMEDQLMRPIQDLVFDQVKQLGIEKGYDYVFDKSGGVMIIYANEDHDLTKLAIDRIKTVLPPRQLSGEGGQSQPGGQPGGQTQPGQTQPGQRQPGSQPVRTPPPTPADQPPPQFPGK